jgi:hypothetical protein
MCDPSYFVILQAVVWMLVVVYAIRHLQWPIVHAFVFFVAMFVAFVVTTGDSSMADCKTFGLPWVYLKVMQIGDHHAYDTSANREVDLQLAILLDTIDHFKVLASWRAIAVIAAVALVCDILLIAQDKLRRWWTSPSPSGGWTSPSPSGGWTSPFPSGGWTYPGFRRVSSVTNANVITANENQGIIVIISGDYYAVGQCHCRRHS